MPDDHSKLVPLLPIPNRTVKRLSADDSADSRVKVGHRQALIATTAQLIMSIIWAFCSLSYKERVIWFLIPVAAGLWLSSCVFYWRAAS